MAFKIANKIRKIESFDIQKNTIEIVAENKEFLAELLRTQLERGLDGNNNPVTIRGVEKYSPFTVEKKRKKTGLSSVTMWITNYDTGDFYKGIKPITDGVRLSFDSNVVYFQEIIRQSGGIIMKLNKQNLELFINTKLKPELQKRMKGGI